MQVAVTMPMGKSPGGKLRFRTQQGIEVAVPSADSPGTMIMVTVQEAAPVLAASPAPMQPLARHAITVPGGEDG